MQSNLSSTYLGYTMFVGGAFKRRKILVIIIPEKFVLIQRSKLPDTAVTTFHSVHHLPSKSRHILFCFPRERRLSIAAIRLHHSKIDQWKGIELLHSTRAWLGQKNTEIVNMCSLLYNLSLMHSDLFYFRMVLIILFH